MKKLALYFLLFTFVMSAQNKNPIKNKNPKTFKYELGFNLFSLTKDINTNGYDQNYFSGIFVKRHFNRNSIRASFDLYRKAINEYYKSTYNDYFYQNNGNIIAGSFRLGYAREFGSKKLKPFLSADLGYTYTEYEGFQSGYNDWYTHSNTQYLIKRNEYTISLGSGLKWKLTNNLQFNYELSGQISRYYSKERSYSTNFLIFNPVRQLGLSILF